MKCLIAVFLMSVGVFAQDYVSDGYHSYPKQECQDYNCVYTGTGEYGFISYDDIDGFPVKKLNSSASFTDVIYDGRIDICYTGEVEVIEDIFEALAGNSEMQYYQGGHQMVRELEMESSFVEIKVSADIKSDYGDYKTELTVPRCN